MPTGKVKWFDNAKGFGFIRCDGYEKDIFVHYSNIVADGFRTLAEGDSVSFDLAQGRERHAGSGPCARPGVTGRLDRPRAGPAPAARAVQA